MLAANDIVVSLVGNRVSLKLDPAGAAITNLGTAFNPTLGVLTITAATSGTLSMVDKVAGISIDTGTDTVSVNLRTLPRFAGISIVGQGGTDSITIGRGGVNLGAVIPGAAAQGLSIDTGAGTDDRIVIAGSVVAKGAGAVNLTTLGTPVMNGILLGAGISAPGGSLQFAGAVTLLRDVAIRAGGDISFTSSVDGAGRLQLAAGRLIGLAGDVGRLVPLKGLTLTTAARVNVGRGLSLDGSGSAVGVSGLVIGANVHNVVFSPISAARTISGFSGAGIRFLGGSQGSRIAGVTSSGNGMGIQIGPGLYVGTLIVGNSFVGNSTAGVSLLSAQGVTIGGTASGAGNSIVSNGGFGVTASGACTGSLLVGNEIGDNPLGQVENFLASRLTGNVVTLSATGFRLQLTDVGRASYLAQMAGAYAFDVTFQAFAVSARSTGRLDTRTASITFDASVGFDTVAPPPMIATGSPPDVLGTNRVVAELTPLKTLPGIEFPRSARLVGSDASGKQYRVTLGLSSFVRMLPLADLENLPITVRNDAPATVDVWVNPQGYASRIDSSFDGGSFSVRLRGHAKATTAPAAGFRWLLAEAPAPAVQAGVTWESFAPNVASAAPPSVSLGTLGLPGVAASTTAANPLLPGFSNGVSGVQVGRSTLSIPSGTGYQAPADWYFPTQVDGTVYAQGVIWLQHAFGTTGGAYSDLAATLAQQTNSIVVAPTLPSDATPQAVASLFAGGRSALKASAVAAGYPEPEKSLPIKFVLAGHSAGGGFATAVAAEYVASHVGASDLAGVIMYDGVSAAAFDGSGRFAQQLVALDDGNIPVYQIAAPAQLWNAYGATTNALMAARPNRFNGVVLVGGSHVDAMQGSDPRASFVAQRVTNVSSPGNAAAVHTLSVGWINDLYAGAAPDASSYGSYASAGQLIFMGSTAAAALPSPIANTMSLSTRMLSEDIDAIGGPAGFAPVPVINTGTNGLSGIVSAPLSNGVTGVKSGTAALAIPCGGTSYTTTANWYFPTQIDGRVAANAVVWLQHGAFGDASSIATLASQIARQTNSVVVVPNISSIETAALPGCFLGSAAMREAVAGMFLGGRGALNLSASAAGGQGPLPQKLLLAGSAAGGDFATSVGSLLVDKTAAANLLGIVMFDGIADAGRFAASLANLGSSGIPVYQIAAPPQAANAWGSTSLQLSQLMPGRFVGVQLDGATSDDFVFRATPSPQGAQGAVITLAVGWINDIYSGIYGPQNPSYGIYSNPNDGTYTPGQSITMGRIRATVLGVLPE